MKAIKVVGFWIGVLMLWCVFTLFASPVSALINEMGYMPFQFHGTARSLGMGEAAFTHADFQTGVFYNPASLNRSLGLEVGNSRNNSLIASEAWPLEMGNTWGIALVADGNDQKNLVGGQTASLNLNTLVGTYTQRLAFIPVFQSIPLMSNSTFGVNWKYAFGGKLGVTGQGDRTLKSGMELDLGWLFEPHSPWTFGFSVTNAMPSGLLGFGKLTWDDDGVDSLPATINTGASFKLMGDQGQWYNAGDLDLLLSAGFSSPLQENRNGQAQFGLEFSRRDNFFLRFGISSLGTGMGFGVRGKEWGGDFAYYDGSKVALSFSYYPEAWRLKEKIIPEVSGILSLTSPQKKQYITAEAFSILRGAVTPGYRLTINGNLAFLDSDNNFSVFVPLNVGKNLIRVIARSEWEKQTFEIKVLRKPKVLVEEAVQVDAILNNEVEPQLAAINRKISAINAELKTKISAGRKNQLAGRLAALAKKQANLEWRKERLMDRKNELAAKKEDLETLIAMGIIEQKPEKVVQLDRPISRSELAVMVAKATGYPAPDVFVPVFDDVPPSNPDAPYIKLVKDLGLMGAVKGNNFYPDYAVSNREGQAIFKKLGNIKIQ